MIMAAPGSLSDGFRMSVFPVAAANGIVHRGIILNNHFVTVWIREMAR
jgi:hypothetical protein